MYKALAYTLIGGVSLRMFIICIQDFENYIKYGFMPLPLTKRKFFRSYTLPFCFLIGYLRYYFQEPPFDYIMKKYYCS